MSTPTPSPHRDESLAGALERLAGARPGPGGAGGVDGISAALAHFSVQEAVPAEGPPRRTYTQRDVAWVLGVAAALLVLLDLDGLLTWARRMELGPARAAWLSLLEPARGGLATVGLTRPRAALHEVAAWASTEVGASQDPLVAQGWRAGAELAAAQQAPRAQASAPEAETEEEPPGSAEEDELPARRVRPSTSRSPSGLATMTPGPTTAGLPVCPSGVEGASCQRLLDVAGRSSTPLGQTGAEILVPINPLGQTGAEILVPITPLGQTGAEILVPNNPLGQTGAEILVPKNPGADAVLALLDPSSAGLEATALPEQPQANSVAPPAEVAPRPGVAHRGPPSVLLLGDSLIAGSLGSVIARGLSRDGRFRVVQLMQSATGLSRPDLFDWASVVPALLEREHPDFIICSFGANDGVTLQKGADSLAFGTRGWRAEYRDRVERMMATLAGTHAHVLWLGLPPMRDPRLIRRSRAINRIFEATTRRVPGVEYFDVRPLISGPDGEFTTFATNRDGALERLRLDDGIHYAPAGSLAVGRWAIDWAKERARTQALLQQGR